MRATVPSYYPLFHCIAGDCKHTCCANWEVDIDPETYDKYQNMSGAFSERLRSSITVEDDGSSTGEAHFVLRPDGRCPMLRDDGLCDLILACGESALCRVCDEHPRFYNFRSDSVECGLGLSCEAALSLILGWDKGFELIDITDSSPMGKDLLSVPPEPADELETEVFGARDNAIRFAGDRSEPLSSRVRELAGDLWSVEERLSVIKSLESLSSAWVEYYSRIDSSVDPFAVLDSPEYSLAFENLLIYLLFRYPWEGARLACELLMMVADCFASSPEISLYDIVREFSSNVEYSDCNVDSVMEKL
ncbi:MAG: flagellin lysine-N-methylase [Clostridiales bacterium]|nr:flagellin lysine-N-methylase [Clostridiales bacterium]